MFYSKPPVLFSGQKFSCFLLWISQSRFLHRRPASPVRPSWANGRFVLIGIPDCWWFRNLTQTRIGLEINLWYDFLHDVNVHVYNPRKLTWLTGNSAFLNRRYIFIHGWVFHCHVNFLKGHHMDPLDGWKKSQTTTVLDVAKNPSWIMGYLPDQLVSWISESSTVWTTKY